MPTISAFYGILIQMYWDEHAPPHFHAPYTEHEALLISGHWQSSAVGFHIVRLRWFGNGRHCTRMN